MQSSIELKYKYLSEFFNSKNPRSESNNLQINPPSREAYINRHISLSQTTKSGGKERGLKSHSKLFQSRIGRLPWRNQRIRSRTHLLLLLSSHLDLPKTFTLSRTIKIPIRNRLLSRNSSSTKLEL